MSLSYTASDTTAIQTAGTLTGTLSATGNSCLSGGTIQGTISGNTFTLTVTQNNTDNGTLTMSGVATNSTMSGSWSNGGGSGTCNLSGTWSAFRMKTFANMKSIYLAFLALIHLAAFYTTQAYAQKAQIPPDQEIQETSEALPVNKATKPQTEASESTQAHSSEERIDVYVTAKQQESVPLNEPNDSFDCSDTIYTVVEAHNIQKDKHLLEVLWFDPNNKLQERTRYEF